MANSAGLLTQIATPSRLAAISHRRPNLVPQHALVTAAAALALVAGASAIVVSNAQSRSAGGSATTKESATQNNVATGTGDASATDDLDLPFPSEPRFTDREAASSTGAPSVVSCETWDLVHSSVAAWKVTRGLFDPSVHYTLVALGYDRPRTWDSDARGAAAGEPGGTRAVRPTPRTTATDGPYRPTPASRPATASSGAGRTMVGSSIT